MSDRLVKPFDDGTGSSQTASHSYQSCWMSRWTQAPSKQGSLIAPHSQSFHGEGGLDHKQKRLRRTLSISSDIPMSSGVIRNTTKAETVGLTDRSLAVRAQNFKKQRSDCQPFCFLGSKNGENAWASSTPMDPSCSNEANSPSARKSKPSSLLVIAAHERVNSDLQPESNLKFSGNFPTSHLSSGRKSLPVSKSSQDHLAGLTSAMPHASDDAINPSKVMVLERHLSDNNFTSLDQRNSKYEKYSAILVHERSGFSPLLSKIRPKDVHHGPNSKFLASQANPPSSCYECQPHEGLPCSVRNVETMRICTTVDSVGNSHGGHPLFSQTTAHRFLFAKQTGVDMSKGHKIIQESTQGTQRRGVKIQPLWSSTDSEKDNNGDTGISKGDQSHDLSAETDTMDVGALSNKNDSSGALLSPLMKHTVGDKTLLMASDDGREDKAKGKMPAIEIPDTNSMDDAEASTSRTQSLEAEHLLSCAEQPSESKSKPDNKECSLPEPSSRCVQRLKLSSSEVGESSSNEKPHMFFDKFMKHNRASPDPSKSDQNGGPIVNSESSSRKSKNMIFQCSWIQRWCQNRAMAPHGHPLKSSVTCEPDTSKLPLDELEKKQFPSIAAMALMGKSMNGFPPCKFTKRGPLIVWNTDECQDSLSGGPMQSESQHEA